jgi:hypothetical protein
MKTYRFEYDVVGVLPFPVDMLRYDRCTPCTEQDSHKIETTIRHDSADLEKPVTVRVCAQGKQKHWLPTTGRWSSFGWQVAGTTITMAPE